MLGNLTFVAQFAYFLASDRNFFVLEQLLSNFRYKKQLLIAFLATFEKLWETFWKISSNLWKALKAVTSPWLQKVVSRGQTYSARAKLMLISDGT